MILPEFIPFQKIARLSREVSVSEKIDGTNAQVVITHDDQVLAGARNRWLTTDEDNYGFAAWVEKNTEELRLLGPGRHYGEWYGLGIGRGYGLKERRFSLFNVSRWSDDTIRPKCCHVVPVICKGMFDTRMIDFAMESLRLGGSWAVPKFMRPEGIVIYHAHSNTLFKRTLEKDELPKSQAV